MAAEPQKATTDSNRQDGLPAANPTSVSKQTMIHRPLAEAVTAAKNTGVSDVDWRVYRAPQAW